jgi:Rnl2 family RNA ligase
VVIL